MRLLPIPTMLATAASLALSVVALPHSAGLVPRGSDSLTAQQIEAISADTASCTGATYPDECRTAAQAAEPIRASWTTYNVSTAGERAATLALMLYESGAFRYNENHYPGVPGQGTRNMQSPTYNARYATALFGAAAVATAQAQGPTAVLALVAADAESFASAAWFLTTFCDAATREGLAQGTDSGWSLYLTECVGTTANEERNALWTKALGVLGG